MANMGSLGSLLKDSKVQTDKSQPTKSGGDPFQLEHTMTWEATCVSTDQEDKGGTVSLSRDISEADG